MNTSISGGNPMQEKTTIFIVFVFLFYYNEKLHTIFIVANYYEYTITHLQKATTFSHSPTPIGMEFQLPH